MQILLSPAKRMNFKPGENEITPTKALFPKKRDQLIAVCNGLTVEEIAGMMKINPAMAHEVQEQFSTFGMRSTPVRAAALA